MNEEQRGFLRTIRARRRHERRLRATPHLGKYKKSEKPIDSVIVPLGFWKKLWVKIKSYVALSR